MHPPNKKQYMNKQDNWRRCPLAILTGAKGVSCNNTSIQTMQDYPYTEPEQRMDGWMKWIKKRNDQTATPSTYILTSLSPGIRLAEPIE